MSVYSNRAPHTPDSTDAYVRAVLELTADEDPIRILEATPSRIERILDATSADALSAPEPPGKWSVTQVVHHLADSELVWGYRLRRTLVEDRPLLDGYDQDVWADAFAYGDVPAAESLALFTALRTSNLRLLKRAGPAALRRTARHAERGEQTLETMIRLYAGHDILHVRQIERVLNAVGAG